MIRLRNREKVLYVMYTCHFSLIAGLRSSCVGSDTLMYNNIFLNTMNKSFVQIISTSKFIGYELLMKIFSSFSYGNHTLFLIFVAVISNGLFFYCAYKFKIASPLYVAFFYVTFYYFFQSMNMTRQTLAIALCVFSFYLFSQKKNISSFLVFICAVLVHSTSIVTIVFLLLYKISWSKKKYMILAIVTFMVALLYPILINLFARLFDSYNMYVNSTVDYSSRGGRILLVIFYTLILIIGIYHSTKTKDYSQIFMTIQGILVISCLLGFLFSSDQLMIRIQMYFEIFLIYYLPMLFIRYRKKYKETQSMFSYMIIPIMLISIVPLIFQMLNNYGQVIPYLSIF